MEQNEIICGIMQDIRELFAADSSGHDIDHMMRVYRTARRIAEAEGEVAKFNKVFEEYQQYPQVTRRRMFFETMEDILPDLDVIISDGNVTQYLPVEALER